MEQIQKIDTLTQLINEFISIEKTKQFSIKNSEGFNIKAVAILIVEREIGVILNVGKNEDIQAGTRLKIFRRDNFTSSGDIIEHPLAIVEVKYVQIGNNCSQAVVIHQIDKDFWESVQTDLLTEQKLDQKYAAQLANTDYLEGFKDAIEGRPIKESLRSQREPVFEYRIQPEESTYLNQELTSNSFLTEICFGSQIDTNPINTLQYRLGHMSGKEAVHTRDQAKP